MKDRALEVTYQQFLLFGACIFSAIIGYVGCKPYILIWNLRVPNKGTPSGYGIIATIITLGLSFLFDLDKAIHLQLAVLLVFTSAYWFDDLFELGPFLRMFLSLSLALFLIYLSPLKTYYIYNFSSLLLFLALLFVFLTLVNFINFCDGADLNLATLIVLNGIGCLFSLPLNTPLLAIIFLWSFFTLGFGFKNYKPNSIYLGDSGSFSFAGILFILILYFIEEYPDIPLSIFIPLAFPFLDNTLVIFYRIIRKENLLSRNFYQLYQRIQIKQNINFLYLLPQIVNFAFCWIGVIVLCEIGIDSQLATIASIIFITPIVYFLVFYFLVGLKSLRLHQDE